MANFELRFLCSSGSGSFVKAKILKDYDIIGGDVIELTIMDESIRTVLLDKSTAIKLSKTLRTEINKITESEV